MQHLENINEVGRGIAVDFVATIYGVGSDNILFLPFAGKLKLRLRGAAIDSRNDAGRSESAILECFRGRERVGPRSL